MAARAPHSTLFAPYRALGLVCDGVQLALYSLGSETFLTTSIGRAFQVMQCDHLGTRMVSVPIPHAIT
jgi:U3 small nucleolar RNA-associated protein 21